MTRLEPLEGRRLWLGLPTFHRLPCLRSQSASLEQRVGRLSHSGNDESRASAKLLVFPDKKLDSLHVLHNVQLLLVQVRGLVSFKLQSFEHAVHDLHGPRYRHLQLLRRCGPFLTREPGTRPHFCALHDPSVHTETFGFNGHWLGSKSTVVLFLSLVSGVVDRGW